MRILKYFLLLLALIALSLTVFILTQSGTFSVKKTFTLEAPQPVIYTYLHDLDNWNDWLATTKQKDNTYTIHIDNIGDFKIKPEYSYPNDSLTQDISDDHKISNIVWTLKPNGKKTDVTMSFDSSLDLRTKVITFFSGTPNQVASNAIEKNINSLMVYFIKQYKNYGIETNGVKNMAKQNYVFLSANASIAEFESVLPKLNKQLKDFCLANNLTITDHPYLILNQSLTNKSLSFEYALPIKEKLYLNDDEEFKQGNLEAITYFNANLTGHYNHFTQGYTEIKQALERGEATPLLDKRTILKLNKSSVDSKKPADWSTDFMIPVEIAKTDNLPIRTNNTKPYNNYTQTDSLTKSRTDSPVVQTETTL